MYFTEKLLLLSMKLELSPRPGVRLMGMLLGILPMWYAQRMEKRLFQGKWDPMEKYGNPGEPGKNVGKAGKKRIVKKRKL